MSEKNLSAEKLVSDMATFLGLKSEAKEVETETKEAVDMASVLEDGDYELADGRTIVISGGDVTEVIPAPEAEEEAPAEEEAKAETPELEKETATEEKAELKEESKEDGKLTEALSEVEKLKAEVAKLSEAKPLTAAPKKSATKQPFVADPTKTFEQNIVESIAHMKNK